MGESQQASYDEPQTRIHLVRHGRVAKEWAGRVYGQLDVALSSEGEQQAVRAARSLDAVDLACVVSSGLARAEFGAACLRAHRGLERRDESALAEIDRGDWAGLFPEEIERRWPGGWHAWWLQPATQRPPGGESLADLRARVLPSIQGLADEFRGGEVAIVAHSWVLRICVTHALGLPTGAATRLELPPASVVVLDWSRVGAGALERPTLAGFCSDRAPSRRNGWFRGPRRKP